MSERERLPPEVWVLGFVSLLMDTSSEMIHGLLPVFMVAQLGASALAVGWVEGIAEATSLIVKVFSGAFSDWFGRRKELTLLGYGLSAATKPFFALSRSVGWVLGARFADRVGKGVRGAPRDALIADVTAPTIRGAAYGLRQALDTVGAFLGPLAAIAFMEIWKEDFRTVFWIAAIPAAACVALLALGLREPKGTRPAAARAPIRREELEKLSARYWWIVALGAVLSLARFSEAFLILRARTRGLPDALAPAVLVLMNVVYAAAAFPAGRLADRAPHRRLLAISVAPLFLSQLALAAAARLDLVAVGIALWGLHLALSQGLLSAMIAAAAPAELRGTAFGVFNLASGVALLAASLLAGLLWQRFGPATPFAVASGFSLLALLLLTLGESGRLA